MVNPADDPTSIGCILVNTGVITEQQLRAAVQERQQVSPDELLGLFMVGKQILDTETLKQALLTQKRLRSNGKTVRALAQAEVASASVKTATAAATRVYDRIRHRHGNNGANAAGK
jgi:hypothetical protein